MNNLTAQIRTKDSKELLKSIGYKKTPARLSVLDLLKEYTKPLTIKEIMSKLDSRKIDQVTVYRILNIFKDAGIVRQIDFQHGHAHFELKGGNDHHHIICARCGKVEDLKCELEELTKKILKKSKNFSFINDHNLELFGICKKCKN